MPPSLVVAAETFPFCLNPSCVIKVPLCISSPSLSDSLSCPVMGVCWWVSLIVGYDLQCHFCLQLHLCPLCGALQRCCWRTCHFLFHVDTSRMAHFCSCVAYCWTDAFLTPETLLSCSATGCLKPPHSFLLQASSPPASGLIVRVYSLNVLSNTLSTYQSLQTIRSCHLDKNK